MSEDLISKIEVVLKDDKLPMAAVWLFCEALRKLSPSGAQRLISIIRGANE
jgi:hypothetical protein